jgi:hypothetical protein
LPLDEFSRFVLRAGARRRKKGAGKHRSSNSADHHYFAARQAHFRGLPDRTSRLSLDAPEPP